MRHAVHLSPVADMPLAYLVEQIGATCLANLWCIELRCALAMQAFLSVSRCAAGAPDRETGQARLGKGEASLGLASTLRPAAFASAFAAGELKAEETWPPPMETLIQMTKYQFKRCLCKLFRQRRQYFANRICKCSCRTTQC